MTLCETFNERNYLGNLDSWYNNVKVYLRGNVIGLCEISAFHHDGCVLEPCAYGLLHGVSWLKFSDFQHILMVQSEHGRMGLTLCPNTLVNFNYKGCNFNSGNYLFTTDTK